LFLRSTCAVFPSCDPYILKTSRLLSWSHFSLLLLLILYVYVIIFIVSLPLCSNIKVTFLIHYVTVNIFVFYHPRHLNIEESGFLFFKNEFFIQAVSYVHRKGRCNKRSSTL
jgi:hypothetical protein